MKVFQQGLLVCTFEEEESAYVRDWRYDSEEGGFRIAFWNSTLAPEKTDCVVPNLLAN